MKAKHWYDYLWVYAIIYFALGFFNILFAWLGLQGALQRQPKCARSLRIKIAQGLCCCGRRNDQIADPLFEGFCHYMLYYKSLQD